MQQARVKSVISKDELKRRAAQSAKDKKIAKKTNVLPVKQQVIASNYRNPLLASALKHEVDLDVSVANSLQTLFNPRAGAHRPYSGGLEETALVTWESTFNIGSLTAINNAVVFAFVPGKSGSISQFNYVNCPSTAFLNPLTDGTSFSGPGPFYSVDPSKYARCISFEATITPTGPNQTLAGAGCVGYIAKGMLDPAQFTWGGLAGTLEKQKYARAFSGSEKLIVHWIPNDQDLTWNTAAKTTGASGAWSGIAGYYIAPGGVAANESFRVDIVQVIEYQPNAAYYPYVTQTSTAALPTTDHYVAKAMAAQIDPLVLGSYEDWFGVVKGWKSLGGHTHGSTHSVSHTVEGTQARVQEPFAEYRMPNVTDVHPGQADRDGEEEEKIHAERARSPTAVERLVRTTNPSAILETGANVMQAMGGNYVPLASQVFGLVTGTGDISERKDSVSFETFPHE